VTKKEEIAALVQGPPSCLSRSADDEPVFVLVARDKFAANLVRRWADTVELASHPDSTSRQKVAEARQLAKRMDAWREAHGGGKVPD
jgi:crotonobetainyl-CoA:carnitine CoA-transferase CaiB-like acyl-CoA transferase